jgi:hypothetical protein
MIRLYSFWIIDYRIKFQAPGSKLQTIFKLQITNSKRRNLNFNHS